MNRRTGTALRSAIAARAAMGLRALAAPALLSLSTLATPALAAGAPLAPIWRTPALEGANGTPAIAGGHLFVVDGGVRALDAASGRTLWHAELAGYAPRCVLAAGGLVYAAEARVTAFDAASGTRRWQYLPAEHAAFACPVIAAGVLYAGTASGAIVALDRNGTPLWQVTPLGAAAHATVVRGLAVDGERVIAAIEQHRSERGDTASGWAVALDRASGRTLWSTRWGELSERRGASAAPVSAGSLLFVADALGNSVVALDRETGRIVWTFTGERGQLGVLESPIVDADRLLVASGDRHVYALDPASGRVLWKTRLAAAVRSVTRCGERLVAEIQGLQVLDAADGTAIARILDSPQDFIASGLLAHDRRLYVGGPRSLHALACD